MKRVWAQRTALGITTGLLSGLIHVGFLAVFMDTPAIARLGGTNQPVTGLAIHLALSALMGATYAWLFRPASGGQAESLMNGLVYGLLGWILLSLNLMPILMGQGPQ
jgi:hypothetical protein